MTQIKYRYMLSKAIINLGLLKRNGINELFNYINNEDVELDKVKILIRKANRELRINGIQLFIRRSSNLDKEAQNRICITRR